MLSGAWQVVHQTLTCAVALGGLLSGREHGQPDGHPQTASWGIGRREGAPVQLHHARRNRQAQARSSRLWDTRLHEAVERLAEMRQRRPGHPRSVVADLNDGVGCPAGVAWPDTRTSVVVPAVV